MTSPKPVRRGLVLGICCVAVLLVGIDMTAVNVALPSMEHDFNAGAAGLAWVIDAYTLILAAFLIFSSSNGDRFGRRRIFIIGLGVFMLGSALCALAPNLTWLIAFRMLQAFGGTMLTPLAMSIISSVFTDSAERAKAIGVWAGVTGLALALGPVVGGAMVSSSLGWRWIFLINIPIGIVTAILCRYVPESKAATPRAFDLVGQILIATMLAGLTSGIIEGPRLGWTSPAILALFFVFIASLIGLLVYEPRQKEPLLQLHFFRSIPFSGANVIAIVAFAGLGSYLYLNSIYLEDARGYGAFITGVLMLPLAIVSIIWGPINGAILAKYGSRIPFIVAGAAFMIAGLMLATVTTETPILLLLIAYGFMGLANSAVGAPITHTAVAGMPRDQAGVASGVNSMTRQVGTTIGVAIAGAMLSAVPISGHAEQLSTATHLGWWLVVCYGLTIVILGIWINTKKAQATVLISSASRERPNHAGTNGHSAAAVEAPPPHHA